MSDNPRAELIALLTTDVDYLTDGRVGELLAMEEADRRALLQGQETTKQAPTQTATPAPEVHAEICIPFEIDGEEFEAVGFLQEGEQSCLGEEAIRRCGDHVVTSEADWNLLYRNRAQLPTELESYVLVTGRPNPDSPRVVSSLYFVGFGWYGGWSNLSYQWGRSCLVVRRRVS